MDEDEDEELSVREHCYFTVSLISLSNNLALRLHISGELIDISGDSLSLKKKKAYFLTAELTVYR